MLVANLSENCKPLLLMRYVRYINTSLLPSFTDAQLCSMCPTQNDRVLVVSLRGTNYTYLSKCSRSRKKEFKHNVFIIVKPFCIYKMFQLSF